MARTLGAAALAQGPHTPHVGRPRAPGTCPNSAARGRQPSPAGQPRAPSTRYGARACHPPHARLPPSTAQGHYVPERPRLAGPRALAPSRADPPRAGGPPPPHPPAPGSCTPPSARPGAARASPSYDEPAPPSPASTRTPPPSHPHPTPHPMRPRALQHATDGSKPPQIPTPPRAPAPTPHPHLLQCAPAAQHTAVPSAADASLTARAIHSRWHRMQPRQRPPILPSLRRTCAAATLLLGARPPLPQAQRCGARPASPPPPPTPVCLCSSPRRPLAGARPPPVPRRACTPCIMCGHAACPRVIHTRSGGGCARAPRAVAALPVQVRCAWRVVV